jgi:hypothetical protein
MPPILDVTKESCGPGGGGGDARLPTAPSGPYSSVASMCKQCGQAVVAEMIESRSTSCAVPPMAWQCRPDASTSESAPTARSASRQLAYAPISNTAQHSHSAVRAHQQLALWHGSITAGSRLTWVCRLCLALSRACPATAAAVSRTGPSQPSRRELCGSSLGSAQARFGPAHAARCGFRRLRIH